MFFFFNLKHYFGIFISNIELTQNPSKPDKIHTIRPADRIGSGKIGLFYPMQNSNYEL